MLESIFVSETLNKHFFSILLSYYITAFLLFSCLFPVPAIAEKLPFFVFPSIAESTLTIKSKSEVNSFDITTGSLYLPSVSVPGLGLIEASLSWLANETEPFQFILTNAVLTSNAITTLATFSLDSGVLHILNVQVNNANNCSNFYQVDMKLIAHSNPLQFYITNIIEAFPWTICATETYVIDKVTDDEKFVINGEIFEPQTYCFGWREGQRVNFIKGSPFGACAIATLYNLDKGDKCEVWC